MSQSIAAMYMRGGTSKGVFCLDSDLPASLSARQDLLLRIMGSPDLHATQIDGMGGATNSTSKIAIIGPSKRADCDVDFIFGAVSVTQANIDWSGSCGQLSAAVGPFAIHRGLVRAQEGVTKVRVWQVNLGKRIDIFVPVKGGQVQEAGPFEEPGVAFGGAEIRVEFLQPGPELIEGERATRLLPTGNAVDLLSIAGVGKLEVSLINAGSPTVMVLASALKLTGKESPELLIKNNQLFDQLEAIGHHAATLMGHGQPQLVWLSKPIAYKSSMGQDIAPHDIDILARMMTAGKMHPALSTAMSIALGVACAVPGTLANKIARTLPGIATRIGHPLGCIAVGADVSEHQGSWAVDKAVLSRSARRLMTGVVHLP
jgi:2-methylaconitate isomerase